MRWHPIREGQFHALAAPLRDVRWTNNFKIGCIDKYDGSSNPEEFIQVYQTVIEATGGHDRVKAKYLPMALSDMARSWLINLPKGFVYTWDQYVPCSSGTFRAHTSIHLQRRP
jgi:hypothetical protein